MQRRAAAVFLAAVLVGAAGSLVAASDRPGTVELTFAPPVGTELDYETEVESLTVTDRPGEPPTTERVATSLDVHQQVVEIRDDGVLVDVALTQPSIGTRTFTVRFDRAAQLTAFEAVEGVPSEAIGELGLSEIFPAGAGAPPDRPLRPGDRWPIDSEVPLSPDQVPARLSGEGRLVALGVEDGRDTATVRSRTRLPVRTSRLDGVQVTEVTSTYDLADGTVLRTDAVTTGVFRLVVQAPTEGGGDPLEGSLRVELRSQTRRVG
ncbi:MAG: hypothetical protein ACRD0G_13440 [Acidimicrobiales bacterium]